MSHQILHSLLGMKTPLSPPRLFAFGGMCQKLMEAPSPPSISLSVLQTPSPGQGGAYSLCEVCNLQLTSDAQAQLHYNGRSHLRRVRQIQAGETGKHAAGHLLLQQGLSPGFFHRPQDSALGLQD
ncbi:unnamed protein product [Pleuronectes platessa]|uniref:C2H2-type domain-containing protein n=1 Tax=Pleuronectes platessa TaxID=8262 RepID=A0A9N7UIM0_PLEPL|nr:unnamed protein product [Pleuronectes platessa]